MDFVKDATVNTIIKDEFAYKTIEATRAFLYGRFRDWDRVTRDGKIPFKDDDAAIGYVALSGLLGRDPIDTPDMGDATVNVSGVQMKVATIEALQTALRKG